MGSFASLKGSWAMPKGESRTPCSRGVLNVPTSIMCWKHIILLTPNKAEDCSIFPYFFQNLYKKKDVFFDKNHIVLIFSDLKFLFYDTTY